jgi:hypothetical protein
VSREQLIADALRLENAQPDAMKDLWMLGIRRDGRELVLIVEAVTGPGALGVADTLDLIPLDPGDIALHGPHHRGTWPQEYWYRWLTADDVEEMERG